MSAQVPERMTARLGRLTIIMIAAGGLVLALAGVRAVNGIVAPTLLGIVIVVTVYPLARRMHARGLPVWLAILTTMLVSYGIILVLFVGTTMALVAFVRTLPQYQQEVEPLIGGVVRWLEGLGISSLDLTNALADLSPQQITGAATAALGSVGSALVALLLMLTVTFFLVLDSGTFPGRFAAMERARPELARALRQFATGTRTYLLVATVFGGIVALVDVGILYLLDIPYPWTWGMLAFLTGYIPNVGFVVGLIPVAILALLGGGWSDMIAVIVAYCVVNFVLQSLIQPKFVGDSVGLATTVTFLSLAFWTFVVGPIGAILAVPLTLLAKALLLSTDPDLKWAELLISSGKQVGRAHREAALIEQPPAPEDSPITDTAMAPDDSHGGETAGA
jgi:AI-2 transport protein TqsA